MARCTDLCTKYTRGYCALCEARAVADRFCWRWFKGGVLIDGWRGLRRELSGNVGFWSVLATLVIAAATAIYTYTSTRQWDVMERQLRVMEYQQRPWLGIPQLQPTQETVDVPLTPGSKNLYLKITAVIKNFGKSPAFAVNSRATFIYPNATITSDLVHGACQEAKALTLGGIGNVVFPDSDFLHDFEDVDSFRDTRELSSYEVRICIAYHDAVRQMYYTQLWLHSTSPPDAPWIELNPGRPFRYRLMPGLRLITQEAY